MCYIMSIILEGILDSEMDERFFAVNTITITKTRIKAEMATRVKSSISAI